MKLLNIAHRGASGITPENTASSIKEAIKIGADAIELDIHITKDKKVVVIHDSSVNRTSNGTGLVRKMTLQELKKLNFNAGKYRNKILTLTEALNLINNKSIALIEPKNSMKSHEHAILDAINKSSQKIENIWIHSFHKKIIKNIRKLNSQIKLGYIIDFSFWEKFLMPYYKNFISKHSLSFFSLSDFFLSSPSTQKLISKLKDLNVETYIWTVNNFHSVHLASKSGAAGIITNYPGITKEILKQL